MKFRDVFKMTGVCEAVQFINFTLKKYTAYCFGKGCVRLCGVDIEYWCLSDWTHLQWALYS